MGECVTITIEDTVKAPKRCVQHNAPATQGDYFRLPAWHHLGLITGRRGNLPHLGREEITPQCCDWRGGGGGVRLASRH